jgi:hypothetical protein
MALREVLGAESFGLDRQGSVSARDERIRTVGVVVASISLVLEHRRIRARAAVGVVTVAVGVGHAW